MKKQTIAIFFFLVIFLSPSVSFAQSLQDQLNGHWTIRGEGEPPVKAAIYLKNGEGSFTNYGFHPSGKERKLELKVVKESKNQIIMNFKDPAAPARMPGEGTMTFKYLGKDHFQFKIKQAKVKRQPQYEIFRDVKRR